MSLLTRKELLDRLNNNVVDIYFTKVNGQNRKMRATLCPSLMEDKSFDVNHNTQMQRNEPQESGTIAVYDLDINEWRSFKIENVHATITPGLGEVRSDGRVQLD